MFYLRRRLYGRPTHALFDTAAYRRRNEDAREYPGGPIAHYDDVGAPTGLQPNAWLEPDADGRWPDLRAWVGERYDDWLAARGRLPRMWRDRPREGAATKYRREAAERLAATPLTPEESSVSVIVNAGVSESHLRHSLRSLVGQTWPASEVLVVHIGRIDEIEAVVTEELPDLPLTLIAARDEQLAPALNEAVAAATGRHLAFLDAADSWETDRLSLLVDALRHVDSPMVADVMRSVAKDGSVNFAVGGHPEGGVTSRFGIDLGRIVIDTEAVADVGGFDPTMRGAWVFDLVVRLSRAHPITVLPTVGVHRNYRERHHARRPSPRYRPVTDHVAMASWADVFLNRHLVDWEALARKRQDPATISVIIPTYEDWRLTEGAVRSVLASDPGEGRSIDCIVWDNGSSAAVHAVLASLKVRYPEIRLEHSPVNHGFALGNNLAVPYARGDTIVFLNNDVEVPPDWLTPITRALADEGVLGVQPLLVYPSGAVQSAGVAFPSTGGLPHAFLQGFPPEDASEVGDLRSPL